MKSHELFYNMCDHWTQTGLGYAFPSGWIGRKRYEKTFSTAYNIYKAIDAIKSYPGLIIELEFDSFAYKEVEAEDPGCIEQLKTCLREGSMGIVGGTFGQPLGQDYGWESNIRHLTFGRKIVQDVLDYPVETFFVEEQWFHPQMPQLLNATGFSYACLQSQNSGQVKPMEHELIVWKGIEASSIPTIPSNTLQVSCVRQYSDYTQFRPFLARYHYPLLLQWTEIWPPGMDWGASVVPFEPAIKQVFSWEATPTTLAAYIRRIMQKYEPPEIELLLDDSHYRNDWYQAGGWGYDGDRVIMLDVEADNALRSYETLAALLAVAQPEHYGHEKQLPLQLDSLWETIMILQNHDFSVARNYQITTPEGFTTEAGQYACTEYRGISENCSAASATLLQTLIRGPLEAPGKESSGGKTLALANTSGIPHTRVVRVENGDEASYREVNLPAIGYTIVPIHESGFKKGEPRAAHRYGEEMKTKVLGRESEIANGDDLSIEDDRFRVEWIPKSWGVRIKDKNTGMELTYYGFSGPIGKVNEHDRMFYPALSPAHENFSFAFGGYEHAPDQVAAYRVEAHIEESTPIVSTLALTCNLLTLHTTDTPAASAELRVNVEHESGCIELESFLYTGVPLELNCFSVLEHPIRDVRYFRDFPFGEQEALIDEVYPNSYTRATGSYNSKPSGFTLLHYGTQRAHYTRHHSGGSISHLLARDQVKGEYTWRFSLITGAQKPWESMRFSIARRAALPRVPLETNGGAGYVYAFLSISDPHLLLSALYCTGHTTAGAQAGEKPESFPGKKEHGEGYDAVATGETAGLVTRFVNFSPATLSTEVTVRTAIHSIRKTDLRGYILESIEVKSGKENTCSFIVHAGPWEILTFTLHLEG